MSSTEKTRRFVSDERLEEIRRAKPLAADAIEKLIATLGPTCRHRRCQEYFAAYSERLGDQHLVDRGLTILPDLRIHVPLPVVQQSTAALRAQIFELEVPCAIAAGEIEP